MPLGQDHLSPAEIDESVSREKETVETPPEQIEKPATAEPVEEDWEPASDAARPLVLIVEDTPDMRAFLRSLLEENYRVIEAADGAAGLALAKQAEPDLVLSDLMMPVMDGYALCRAIKEDAALDHVPVVLLTARADDESRLEGLGLGADDYLQKPFQGEELLVRVENLIEVRRRLRDRFSRSVAIGPSQVEVSSVDEQFMDRVREEVEAHLGDMNFGVDWLADEVGLSRRQLGRRLKAAAGLSPSGYLRLMRLERAAQLLSQQAGSVQEIAYQVGFRDSDYFSKLFRQAFGVAPSAYPVDET
jgi:DNA-binding response OmpR family regulator